MSEKLTSTTTFFRWQEVSGGAPWGQQEEPSSQVGLASGQWQTDLKPDKKKNAELQIANLQ